jgi:hypothetical protein
MKAKPTPKLEDVELIPDAWERFGEFVKRIAKAGPQHRIKPKADAPTGRKRSSKKAGNG